MKRSVLRTLAGAAFALLWCGTATAGASAPVGLVPELDPGTASGGIALAAVAAILLVERYRNS